MPLFDSLRVLKRLSGEKQLGLTTTTTSFPLVVFRNKMAFLADEVDYTCSLDNGLFELSGWITYGVSDPKCEVTGSTRMTLTNTAASVSVTAASNGQKTASSGWTAVLDITAEDIIVPKVNWSIESPLSIMRRIVGRF